jgi:hypothetical protein
MLIWNFRCQPHPSPERSDETHICHVILHDHRAPEEYSSETSRRNSPRVDSSSYEVAIPDETISRCQCTSVLLGPWFNLPESELSTPREPTASARKKYHRSESVGICKHDEKSRKSSHICILQTFFSPAVQDLAFFLCPKTTTVSSLYRHFCIAHKLAIYYASA